MDEATQTPCCLITKDEIAIETGVDAGLVNCERCPVRLRLSELDAENHDAWARYRHLTGHRLTWDDYAGKPSDWWLAHVLRDVDADDLDDLMARLRVLHDTFLPPKTES